MSTHYLSKLQAIARGVTARISMDLNPEEQDELEEAVMCSIQEYMPKCKHWREKSDVEADPDDPIFEITP